MIDINKIYTSKSCGDFRIIEYASCMEVYVEFLATGYRVKAQAGWVREGSIKDRLLPTRLGVGFIGDGPHKSRCGKKKSKVYLVWSAMLDRCYSLHSRKHNPTYSDATVCEEWHNFQAFAEWFYDNYVEGFHIDKDIKQGDVVNKVYSPETCSFVSQQNNNEEANAKKYKFRNPKGEICEIFNMTKFARENNLGRCSMGEVHAGKQGHHKGWTKA